MTVLSALVAADVWIMRTVLGGRPNETMSGAAWNAHISDGWWGWTYLLIDLLFYPVQRDHCMKSWIQTLYQP